MSKRTLAAEALKALAESDSRRAAAFLESLEAAEAGTLLRAVPDGAAEICFRRLNPSAAGTILAAMGPADARGLIEKLDPHIAADAFRSMGREERDVVFEGLSEQRKRDLREMISYPEDSAGRLMSTDFAAFREGASVKDVVQRLRALAKKGRAPVYSYVVGEDRKLLGVLIMRDLLLAEPSAAVETVMAKGVEAVTGFTDKEDLVRLAQSRRYLAVPVVDAENRILGQVRMNELLESSQSAASEDIQLMFGAGPDEKPSSPLWTKVSCRLPWLQVNLVTAFMAGAVVALFEDLIAQIAALAVFLPIVAGQGGNAGTQTLAVMLRGLIMREIKPDDAWRAISVEMGVGAVNGAVTGLVTAVIAWIWKGNPYFGLVIGLAMIVNLIAAGAAGAAIPLGMKRLGLDPAQSSGILLTTVTDIVGFFAFLGFASLFKGFLL